MKIEAGYDIAFNCVQEVPLILMLSVHPSRQPDLLSEHKISFSPNAASRNCSSRSLRDWKPLHHRR